MPDGTDGNDVLYGSDGDDVIDAKAGRDKIYGSIGTDTIVGGSGTDTLTFDFLIGTLATFATNSRTFTLTGGTFSSDGGTINTAFSQIETFEFIGYGFTNSTFNIAAASGAGSRSFTVISEPAKVSGNNTFIGSNLSDQFYVGGAGNAVDGGAGLDVAVSAPTVGGASHILTIVFDGSSGHVDQDGATLLTVTNVEYLGVGDRNGLAYSTTGLVVDGSGATAGISFFDSAGSDIFIGGPAADGFGTINIAGSGGGEDYFIGGAGGDTFDFVTSVQALDGSYLLDFEVGDVIDLSLNDGGVSFLVATSFIGEAAFSGTPGEVRYQRADGRTVVQIDSDGNATVDATLQILNGEFVLEAFDPWGGGGGFGLRASGAGTNSRLILGTLGNDNLNGTASDDLMIGLTGGDTFIGGTGNDYIIGGSDNDYLQFVSSIPLTLTDDSAYAGDDVFDGGAGFDNVSFRISLTGVTVDLRIAGPQATGHGNDAFVSIESIDGSRFADVIHGDDNANYLAGGGTDGGSSNVNNDTIFGHGGNDTIRVGYGTHTADGGSGIDILQVSEIRPPFNQVGSTVSLALQGSAQDTGHGMLTATGFENLSGDYFNDVLTGDANVNTLIGSLGSDTIHGGSGNDVIHGDAYLSYGIGGVSIETNPVSSGPFVLGNDLLFGDEGNDTIFGNGGNDTLDGGIGADTMSGGIGDDLYYVDNGGDVVTELVGEGLDEVRTGLASYALTANVENLTGTSGGGQTLVGNGLANTIQGGAGNDVINGLAGNDVMKGGAGNDAYYVYDAGDVVSELYGEGTDIVYAYASHTLGANVENLTLLAAGLIGTGNAAGNLIYGSGGADTIYGMGGGDRIDGGGGNDVIHGGDGADSIWGSAGNDTIHGDAGLDYMVGGTGDDTYYVDDAGDTAIEQVGEGTDTVYASTAYHQLRPNIEVLIGTLSTGQTLVGNYGADTIQGGAGNDTLNGLTGNDTMKGGAGNDGYYVYDAGDVVVENPGEGTDTVYTYVSHTLEANVENLTLLNAGQVGTGNGLANTIYGSSGIDTIFGLGGADQIASGGGADTIDAGEGDDLVWGGAGNDVIRGGLGFDRLRGEAGADRFVFGEGETSAVRASADRLLDFSQGDGDKIDLSGIDANAGVAGDQAFAFIGSAAFTNVAGQLRFEQSGGYTYVEGDTNGDAIADFSIQLGSILTPTVADFVL